MDEFSLGDRVTTPNGRGSIVKIDENKRRITVRMDSTGKNVAWSHKVVEVVS